MKQEQSQSNKTYAINSFEKGLYLGVHDSVQPKGTYKMAMNLINRDPFQNEYLSNEHGTVKLDSFDDVIGDHFIKSINKLLIITKSGEIYLLDPDPDDENNISNKEFVMSFSEYSCKLNTKDCEYISIESVKVGCDIIIYFSSNNIYYKVNITEQLDKKRKKLLKEKILKSTCRECNADCTFFTVNKSKCNALGYAIPYQTGGSLPAGVYVYSIRLENQDGSLTNWSTPFKPVSIGSDNNIPGEESNGRIELKLKNLDCRYNKLSIACTYFKDTGIFTKILDPVYFNKSEYTYIHENVNGIDIETSEILKKDFSNIYGSGLITYNNRMYYHSIRGYRDYNIQKIANDVKINIIVEKYNYKDVEKYQIPTLPYGETIALGLVINHDDGTHSPAAHIPCNNSKKSGILSDSNIYTNTDESNLGTKKENTSFSDYNITQSTDKEHERKRSSKDNTVSNLSNDDELLDIEKQLVDSYNTDINDIVNNIKPTCDDKTGECTDCGDGSGLNITNTVTSPDGIVSETTITGSVHGSKPKNEINQFCNRNNAEKDGNIVNKDLPTSEKIAVKWASILSDYIGKDGKEDLIKSFTPNNIKDVAQSIINSIKNRERIFLNGVQYDITKKSNYDTDDYNSSDNKEYNTEFPGGIYVGKLKPKCKSENIKYPCIRDCDGNYIYGDLVGKNVSHFTLPDENEINYFVSNSIGVPSKLTPDADEYNDIYINILGIEASNINIDYEDYYLKTGKKVCKKNPFKIVKVPLTSNNRTILLKGLITSNFVSENKGKKYVYQKPAVNSFETVNKYIDKGSEVRIELSPTDHNSVCLYSLDQSVLQPYLGDNLKMKILKRFSGIGYRHGLYSKGESPSNKTYGRRIDQRGCRSATNLSSQENKNEIFDVTYAIYADPNSVISPPKNGKIPLMNKYGQSCLWIGLDRNYSLTDSSFVGDVLNHEAPIVDAKADYVSLYRELTNQYGSLESLMYMPILEAYGEKTTSVKGLCGSSYISPYSYVKTHYISDKIGEKFLIGQKVPGKSARCVCDTPEDAINSLVGKNFWTDIPVSGDLADAKNWAGTHSTISDTKTWEQAINDNRSLSQYYYPGTLTHLNTYVGESISNPFMLQLDDELKNQRYNKIKSKYYLDSSVDGSHNWEDCYLNQFYVKNQQPSAAEKIAKVLLKSFINLILPLLKIEDLFSPNGSLDLTGDIASMPIMIAIFLLLSKVLFTDDFIDEFIGIPKCKTDKEGGIEFKIEKFFKNYNKYSYIYSKKRDLYQIISQQEFTNCFCDDGKSDYIYFSDEQNPESHIDGYSIVRPFNKISFNEMNGSLIDMFIGLDNRLYLHTTDSIYLLNVVTKNSNIEQLSKGNTSNIFIQPQLIIGGNPEGFAGIVNKHHAINSKYGRYFISYDTNKLFHYTGGSNLKELSVGSLNYIFSNYTKYCNSGDCINEFKNNTSYYTLGIDPRFDRLLITKSDGKSSWTFSYDILESELISFHSYIPNKYIVSSKDLLALKNNSVYTFKTTTNFNLNNNGIYFGKTYPFFIDFKSNFNLVTNYLSSIILSSCDKKDLKNNIYLLNRKIFFDKIAAWNSWQTSGYVNLLPIDVVNNHRIDDISDNTDVIYAKFVNNEWRINELHDYTMNYDEQLIEFNKECNLFYELVNYFDFSNKSKQNYKNRILRDSYLNFRLFKNNLRNYKLYLKNVVTLHKSKIR